MGSMLFRGLQIGLVGGIGFDILAAWLSDWQLDSGLLTAGLVIGLLFGLGLGLGLMLFLVVLRLVDRLTGWHLAARLQAAEPGAAGLIAGMLCTAPGMVLAGVGSAILSWQWCMASNLGGYQLYLALMVVPLSIFFGSLGGAMLGALVGNGVVGALRGVGILRR